MIVQESFTVHTPGRGTYEVTERVRNVVRSAGLKSGLVHVFVHHTSASLILCENADPAVRRDLEAFMARLVPDDSALFEHAEEGPDDMPAHLRTILTRCSLTIPVTDGQCALGTWQGIYLWEHRQAGHARRLSVTVHGE